MAHLKSILIVRRKSVNFPETSTIWLGFANTIKSNMNKKQQVAFIQFLDLTFESSDDDDLLFFLDSSSSSNDEDAIEVAGAAQKCKNKMCNIPRLKNYVERIIPNYTAVEFKMHFRYVFNYKANHYCIS